MHNIEPYYHWRDYYIASEDEFSPFYNTDYDEFRYSTKIYNYYIHPQWDSIESSTLFLKVLFVDYSAGSCVIELIGEWNDCLHNDIMLLKQNIADSLIFEKVNKFIIIGENILNFHGSDDCYYEEWANECEDGWVALINFREHVIEEMKACNINTFFHLNTDLNNIFWQQFTPSNLCNYIKDIVELNKHNLLINNI
tara:strand:- start:648 stop:1235 length:588 start_codon:yes stop_codon:yes gene_type:complete